MALVLFSLLILLFSTPSTSISDDTLETLETPLVATGAESLGYGDTHMGAYDGSKILKYDGKKGVIDYTKVSSRRSLDIFKVFQLPATGPESLTFDGTGGGPYTGACDGRILKYDGCEKGFVDYAYTNPKRTKESCDGTTDPEMLTTCGRPLGMGFNHQTNELYVLDPFVGFCVVGPKGGLATLIATGADGEEFKLPDGLDVDQQTGNVYFTDASAKHGWTEIPEHISSGEASGRLLKYDPKTKEITVLMRNLSGAGGVAVSRDSSFALVSEYTGNRLRKFWLEGPKANTGEIIMSIPGPANVKSLESGEFLVAVNVPGPEGSTVPTGLKIDGSGNVLEIITVRGPYKNTVINEVQEYLGSYYVTSMFTDFTSASKV